MQNSSLMGRKQELEKPVTTLILRDGSYRNLLFISPCEKTIQAISIVSLKGRGVTKQGRPRLPQRGCGSLNL